mmetsp:Transcript_28302/g.76445  ORF Transcript_28302/g.76445 Transcript_28302/m.76445 type:complete len:215 (-) Transcript_28302:863-1507(-)
MLTKRRIHKNRFTKTRCCGIITIETDAPSKHPSTFLNPKAVHSRHAASLVPALLCWFLSYNSDCHVGGKRALKWRRPLSGDARDLNALCRASSMRCAVSVSCSAGVKNSGVARLTSRRVVRTQAKTGDSGARCFCCSHQRFSHSSANTKGAWMVKNVSHFHRQGPLASSWSWQMMISCAMPLITKVSVKPIARRISRLCLASLCTCCWWWSRWW